MTDLNVQSLSLRTKFEDNAARARKPISEAEVFMRDLEDSLSRGVKPAANTVTQGKTLLRQADEQFEVFAFNQAMILGMEGGDRDDAKVATISRSVEQAEQTSARLRALLGKISA